MAAFVVYENVLSQAYKTMDKSAISSAAVTAINLSSGLVAGLAAAVVSQPADTVLSKINRDPGVPGEGSLRRLWRVVSETGFRGSFAGTRARLVMVGGMTAIQFAIYGDVKEVYCSRAVHAAKTSAMTVTLTLESALGATGGIEIKQSDERLDISSQRAMLEDTV